MDFSPSWWPPPFVSGADWSLCAGHGSPAPPPTGCACEEGWVGASDFVDARRAQCHLNLRAVAAMHVLLVAYIARIVCFIIYPRRHSIWRQFKEDIEKKIGRSRAPPSGLPCVIPPESIINTGIITLFLYPTITVFSLIRAVSDLRGADADVSVTYAETRPRLGRDPGLTTLWVVARTVIYTANIVYQPSVLAAVLRAENVGRAVVRRERTVFLRLGSLAVFIGIALAVTIGASELALGGDVESILTISRAAFAVYLALNVALNFYFAWRANWITRDVLRYLHRVERGKTDSVPTRNLCKRVFVSAWNVISPYYDPSSSSFSGSPNTSSGSPVPSASASPLPRPVASSTIAHVARFQTGVMKLNRVVGLLHLALLVYPAFWIAYDYFLPLTWFLPLFASERFFVEVFTVGHNLDDDEERKKVMDAPEEPGSLTPLASIPTSPSRATDQVTEDEGNGVRLVEKDEGGRDTAATGFVPSIKTLHENGGRQQTS